MLAREHFSTLDLNNVKVVIGQFQDTLAEVLNQHKRIGFAFIDGHHDEGATLAYFEKIKPFLSDRAMLVFVDISWSKGMRRAWRSIELDESVGISLDLSAVGICIISSQVTSKQNFRIRMV